MSDSGKQLRSIDERDLATIERLKCECDGLRTENAMLRRSQSVRAEGRIIACAVCETATQTGNDGCCMDCWMAWQNRSPEREVVELRAALAVYAERGNWAHNEQCDCGDDAAPDWIGPRWPPWSIAKEALDG